MVVDRHGEDALGFVLPDNVFVQEGRDFRGAGQPGGLVFLGFGGFSEFFFDDFIAQFNAFVADEHTAAGDELLHLFLTFPAE